MIEKNETLYRINKRGCEMFRTFNYEELTRKWEPLKNNPKYTRQYKCHNVNRRERLSYWDVHWTDF